MVTYLLPPKNYFVAGLSRQHTLGLQHLKKDCLPYRKPTCCMEDASKFLSVLLVIICFQLKMIWPVA